MLRQYGHIVTRALFSALILLGLLGLVLWEYLSKNLAFFS
jgi:hypothetical protein